MCIRDRHCTTEVDNPVTRQSQSHTSSNSKQTGSLRCPTQCKKPKHSVLKTTPPQTAAATVMEYLIKKNESMGSSSSPSQDPVEAFLSGIAPALKKLSPHYWHYAKADIFAVVQKYELKMLMEQQPFAGSSRFSHCSTPMYSEQPSPAGSNHQSTSTSTGNGHQETSSTDQSQQATSPNNSLQQYFENYGP